MAEDPEIVELEPSNEGEGKEYAPRLELEPPKDKYNFEYWCVLILGAGILTPWVTMLQAVDWFKYLYPGREYNFEFNLSVAYMFPLSITMGASTSPLRYFHSFSTIVVKFGNKFGFAPRIISGFVLFFLVFVVIPFLDESVDRVHGFRATLFLAATLGVADAIAQGSLYGFVGAMPPVYTQAFQTGTGVAGLIVSGSRIITKASLPDTPHGLRISSLLYFVFSAMTMLVCIFLYLVMRKMPVSLYAMSRLSSVDSVELLSTKNTEQESSWRKTQKLDIKGIIMKIWPLGLTVCANFLITLFIFPGLITEIPSTKGHEWTWFPVILISLFNFFDVVGKTLPRFYSKIPEKALYIATASRIIFFPLFLLCVKPRFFNNDFFPVIFMIIFALSNGYIGSLTMIFGPTRVDNHEKEVAGTAMAFSLVAGLTLGAVCGWTLPYIVQF